MSEVIEVTEATEETEVLVIADLKATTMVDIILELVVDHGYSSEEAKKFYKDNHEAIKAGTSFVSIFDNFLLEKDRTEKEVIAFLSELGRENKLKTKSHFISRAAFASTLRAKLEVEFNPVEEEEEVEEEEVEEEVEEV